MGIQRLENVGIVLEDLEEAIPFFVDLGLTVQGRATVEGAWVDAVVGLDGVRCRVAVLGTPDGRSALELMQFEAPEVNPGVPQAPPNTLGMRRIAFNVDDVDASVAVVRRRGFELLGDVVQYEDAYRLCYVRGPEGVILMLAEEIGGTLTFD